MRTVAWATWWGLTAIAAVWLSTGETRSSALAWVVFGVAVSSSAVILSQIFKASADETGSGDTSKPI